MVIQIFMLYYCTVMLSSSCANCSAKSVSNYSMPSARPSIQPETLLISKHKKVNTCNFIRDFKIGSHLGPEHVKIFWGCENILSILGVRAITKVGNH